MSTNDPKPLSRIVASWERGSSSGLYRLLASLSPGFPIGSFAFSHGLEAAVASGAIRDGDSLQLWISAIVASGGGRIDADILRDGIGRRRRAISVRSRTRTGESSRSGPLQKPGSRQPHRATLAVMRRSSTTGLGLTS
jgi:hypothetical protein